MKANGQLQPLMVRPNAEGKFDLVFGYRRFLALSEVGAASAMVQVVAGLEDRQAFIINITENLQREGIKPYELAERMKELKDKFNMSGADVAKVAGRTRSHVNNLVRIMDNVTPRILKHFKAEHPIATVEHLLKIAALKDAAEQEELWDKLCGVTKDVSEDDEDGEGSDDAPSEEKKRPSKKALEEMLANARTSAKQAKGEAAISLKGVMQALRFALGESKSIPNVHKPKVEADE